MSHESTQLRWESVYEELEEFSPADLLIIYERELGRKAFNELVDLMIDDLAEHRIGEDE